MTREIVKAPLATPAIIEQIMGMEVHKTADDGWSTPPGWPRHVWVIRFSDKKHGVLVVPGEIESEERIHGLGCFKRKENAQKSLYKFKTDALMGHKFVKLSFEEARRLAKEYGKPIIAMILADNLSKPEIFYVQ